MPSTAGPADPAGEPTSLAGVRVLLGVSGGIAAYKAASLARALLKRGAEVQAVLTAGAAAFVTPATFEGLTGRPAPTEVFTDVHDIIHVRMARWADVAVIAPATANIIAKLATGIADDLLTSTALTLTCPVLVAPAMHTEMWLHPATQANVATLAARGVRIVGPDEGQLAGGDVGPGRLVEEDELVAAVLDAVAATRPRHEGQPLAGRRVVVTAGGTHEAIDPVRYLGNRSSGKMGYAVAAEAARRGARVELISANATVPPPAGVHVVEVGTALEMREAVLAAAADADVVVKAAAVADFRPAEVSATKLKKDVDAPTAVPLVRNPDILAELGADKRGRILVGFAAETDLPEEHGRAKLERKRLDLIVINRVDRADAGFAVDTNAAVLLGADGSRTEIPLSTKTELAAAICDRVERLLPLRGDARAS